METGTIIKETTVNAPPSAVWKAISDKDEMKQWYFDLAEFKPEVGFEFQFYGGTEEHQYLHLCKITEAIPNKKLAYSWKYDGFPGESFVTFDITDEGGRTRVTLTHTGLDTFPADNPDLTVKNFKAGWEEIIGTSLPKYVERK